MRVRNDTHSNSDARTGQFAKKGKPETGGKLVDKVELIMTLSLTDCLCLLSLLIISLLFNAL